MPKLQLSPPFSSLRGTLDGLVIKHYSRDKRGHVLSRKPDMSAVEWSPAQRAQRERMKAAAAYHREVLADPVRLRGYAQLARKRGVPLSAVTMGEALRQQRSV